jgi:predicted alpha-1,2-mannosidase
MRSTRSGSTAPPFGPKALLGLGFWACLAMQAGAQQPNIARELVDPFIGTGGHGHTLPGACVPFGMAQLSPDTRPDGSTDWDGASGYHHSDSLIYGFSHTHLSGTGVSDLCDVLLMPMTDSASVDPERYRSPFRKATEQAHAGYYRVHLDGPDVSVELTATPRSGVHRYSYPPGREAFLVLDLEHRDFVAQASIVRVNEREVVGERRSSSWAKDQRLFYCIRTNHPMRYLPQRDDRVEQIAAANRSQDVFAFGDLQGEPLIVRVGISAVSIEGARANLEAEAAGQDFDRLKADAEQRWNTALGRIRAKGGTLQELRTFYTALYHTMIAPGLFSDVDGRYRGMDGAVHHADHAVYTVFSLWDTFRGLHPLMTILEPERTADWIRTMLLHYQQSDRLPVWELWGNETDCMIGHHSVSVIADAYAKGIRDFDAQLALAAMVSSAEQDRFGLKAYRERGYISSEDEAESVSRTLEYAYDDACIARFAAALGEDGIAERYATRSRNWQNLYDPATGFFRPRRNGGFIEPFDPYEVNFHFTESNAWHYSLFVPHDPDRLTGLLGGPQGLADRLDALFTARSSTTGRDQADITGLVGQYAHGNEPSHASAYLYTRSTKPENTGVYVRRIMQELYNDTSDGLSGNDDCGQLSAWYVLSAMGFYPTCPGEPAYSLGIPLFDTLTVALPGERELRIVGAATGGSKEHLVDVRWNGEPLKEFLTLDHAALVQGGELRFELGAVPGSPPIPLQAHADDAAEGDWIPAPLVQAAGRTFRDTLSVSVTCPSGPWTAVATLGMGPAELVPVKEAIYLDSTARIRARCRDTQGLDGPEVLADFVRTGGSRTIRLESSYAAHYAGGGDQAMIDGLRGGGDYRSGEWQGYQGQDIVASVDLGRMERIERLGIGVLQDTRSWIWYPQEVEFLTSTNGRNWSSTIVPCTVGRDAEGAMTMELWTPFLGRRARYVNIVVRSAGPCPDWHPGAGAPSWLFVDELLVEPE